ncbi:alpha/beta hydrolase fold protein [Hyaloscypha sp. PMI_1271]|nr:alpha/beta hydrolase fold protein [Hyaloscypha sp. PMI_1271]
MPSVSTREGDVSYSVNGTGPPILLLHANLHSSQDFASIIPKLSLHYQTFAIDFPWHGASTGTSHIQPTAPHLADALEDLVIALDLPPAVFIGNSVGGFSSARLAITHPWSFALKAVAHPLSIPWINRLVMPSLVWKYMLPQTDLDKSIAEQVSARARTIEGSKVAAGIWSSFPSPEHDLRSRSEELKAPTLLVWGKRDPVAPLSAGIATQKCIKGSRLEVLDTGHVVFASRPEEFLELVEPFIKECFRTG